MYKHFLILQTWSICFPGAGNSTEEVNWREGGQRRESGDQTRVWRVCVCVTQAATIIRDLGLETFPGHSTSLSLLIIIMIGPCYRQWRYNPRYKWFRGDEFSPSESLGSIEIVETKRSHKLWRPCGDIINYQGIVFVWEVTRQLIGRDILMKASNWSMSQVLMRCDPSNVTQCQQTRRGPQCQGRGRQ